MNFKLWNKVDLALECSSGDLICKNECEKFGGILDKDGSCHAYEVIDRICLSIDIMRSEDGRSEELYLAGGCYDGNHPTHYSRAKPGI